MRKLHRHVSPPLQPTTCTRASPEWTESFRRLVDAQSSRGYPILDGPGQLDNLPWTTDQITLQFSEHVQTSETDVAVYGTNVPSYLDALADLEYFPDTAEARLTFPSPFEADKLLLVVGGSITDMAGNQLDGEWADESSHWPSGDEF